MINREHLHQLRHTSRWTHLQITAIGLILLIPVALAARYNFTAPNYSPILITTQTVIWTFHGIVLLRIFTLSTHIATRDYAGNTWELIALTGVSARAVLWAKWRAALHAVRGWSLALGLLRLGILPCSLVVYVIYTMLNPPWETGFWTSPRAVWLVPLLMVGFTLILTLLDIAYSTLLGVVSGIIMRRFPMAMLLAFLVRFLPVILLTMIATQEGYVTTSNVWVPWRWWITLVEGGTGALIRIPIPNLWYYAEDSLLMQWIALGLAVIVFSLWLGVVWWIGLKALERRGALSFR